MADDIFNTNENEEELTELEKDDKKINSDENDNFSAKDSDNETVAEKPRKRKIIKNNPFPIIITIILVLLVFLLVWKFFFDKSLTGTWHYFDTYEVTETYDVAETADTATYDTAVREYTEKIVYNFNSDGSCEASIGAWTIPGEYSIYEDESGNPAVFISIIYQYQPVVYGSFNYEVKGNVFTGRSLILNDNYGLEQTFSQGRGEELLKPFSDFEVDTALVGKWTNEEEGMTWTFDEKGYMVLTTSEGYVIEHVYTTMENSFVLSKTYNQQEESYSYYYAVDGDKLDFNGSYYKRVK